MEETEKAKFKTIKMKFDILCNKEKNTVYERHCFFKKIISWEIV